MHFGLFQTDCEGRGAILWEPNSQADIDVVDGLLNLVSIELNFLNGLSCHPTIFPQHDLLLFVKYLAANILFTFMTTRGSTRFSTNLPYRYMVHCRMLFHSHIKTCVT